MNHACPACLEKRLHTPDEDREFHPLKGHGFTPESGWTCPAAKAAHEADLAVNK